MDVTIQLMSVLSSPPVIASNYFMPHAEDLEEDSSCIVNFKHICCATNILQNAEMNKRKKRISLVTSY